MNTPKRSVGRRLVAALGVAALSLAGAVGITTAASADAVLGIGNINPDTQSSLTIHKYDGTPGSAGQGNELTDTSALGNPLNGVGFSIRQVTEKDGESIDLDTAAGWDLISGVTVDQVTGTGGDFSLGTVTNVVTGSNGSTPTANLAHGLYLVQETSPGANQIVSPAQPFLVTLPLPQGNGGWLYDVHAYPKNKVNTTVPTKTVADPSVPVVGSTVTWTITAPVPDLANGDTYRSFIITDQLDSRLTYTSAAVTGFTAETDYKVTEANGLVTITFTDVGLGKLSAGQSVVATLVTKVNSTGDGTITNQANVNTNGSTVTTGKPSTNWGGLRILKYAKDDVQKTLSGAVFGVYTDSAATQQVATLTTGADGTASIVLWVGNNDTTSRVYYLKETAAPAGYVLDGVIRQVTVNAGTEAAAVQVSVANTQQKVPNLPLTGANGQLLALIGGGSLVLLAAGTALVARKRSHQD